MRNPFFLLASIAVVSGCMIRENQEWNNILDPDNPRLTRMVRLPAGRFVMGSGSSTPGREDENLRTIRLSSFLLDSVPVTQKRWSALMDTNPSGHANCPNCPVENVTWFEAVEFCNRLSKREGLDSVYSWTRRTIDKGRIVAMEGIFCHRDRNGYRLPTEAELEYATRAGSKGLFPWGDDTLGYEQYAWVSRNSNGKSHPVATMRPNAWGLYDMVGNVWQWGGDWYWYPYGMADTVDPTGKATGDQRVRKGGSYSFDVMYSTSANRGWEHPDSSRVDIGFRCARGVGF